jgi:hypothetical protein
MEREPTAEVEMTRVDLRYERCRLKSVRAERELLAEIRERGIDRPLSGVESGSRWILIDGFKRFRCARSLGMGSVPCVSLGADEAAGILEMLKGPGWKPLGFLEEARFLQELQSAHGMTLAEMAAALGRSKSWASMRLSALADMSETVRDRIFRGSFPAYAYLYFVRPFMRMNGVDAASVDAFVRATSGRGLSTREIARLAEAYFRGPDEMRRQIAAGHVVMALNESAGATPSGGCSARERSCLKDLEQLVETMARLTSHAADSRLKSGTFRAQAQVLLARVISRADDFTDVMRRFHGRCEAT